MDRSQSEDHIAFGPATPWDTDTFAARARRGRSEPVVPKLDKTRPSRSNSVKPPRPTQRSVTQRSDASHHRATPPPEEATRHHRMPGTFSAQASPRPYETPFYVPSPAPAAPSPPPCYTKAVPRTPPESFSEKSTASTDKSASSPSSKPAINFMPGTMSARHARSRASSRQRTERRKKQQQPTKVHRWKVVFREIFTKTPVDESQFERIKDRHWTDE